MNILIAKISSEYKQVLSQKGGIVEELSLSQIEALDFTTSHKLEDEEWFKLTNFSKNDFFIDACKADYSSASLAQISNAEYKDIGCIAVFQNGQKHFQRITPSLFVNKKTILDYSGEPKIVEHRQQLEIRQESDAVYIVEDDVLYFRHIAKIKSIFPGIDRLHREATQPEVDDFLNNGFIALSAGYNATSVGSHNRKRIADIGIKYQDLTPEKQTKLIEYAKEKAGVDIQDDVFQIGSERELKNLLYAMDQRYYYADIYEENRVASSVRVVAP